MSNSDWLGDDEYRLLVKNLTSPPFEKSLEYLYPKLAAEWHPEKNKPLLPSDFLAGSGLSVWWVGECGHEWEAKIYGRAYKGYGCQYCYMHFVPRNRSIKILRPDMAAWFCTKRNGEHTVENTSPSSVHQLYWKCPNHPNFEIIKAPVEISNHREITWCSLCHAKYEKKKKIIHNKIVEGALVGKTHRELSEDYEISILRIGELLRSDPRYKRYKKSRDDLIKRILELRSELMTTDQIGEIVGLSGSRITDILKEQKDYDDPYKINKINVRNKVKKLALDGKTRSQIAKIMQISIGSVRGHFEALNANPEFRSVFAKRRDDFVKKIIELSRELKTTEDIGNIVGLSASQVGRILAQQENFVDPYKLYHEDLYKSVCKLHQEGKTHSEISKVLGISLNQVKGRLDRYRKRGQSK